MVTYLQSPFEPITSDCVCSALIFCLIFVMLNTKGGVLLSSDLPLRTAAKAYVLAHQAGKTGRGRVCFCCRCLCHTMPVKGGCLPRAGAKAPVVVP